MRTEDDARIVEMKAQGHTHKEIAAELGIPVRTVADRLKDAAMDARRRVAEVAEERAAMQDARVEWLIQKVSEMIRTDGAVFDEKKWKVAIQLLERQAKLFGIDRAKDAGDRAGDWLSSATEQTLRDEAEKLGLKIPEKFHVE